VIIRVLHEGQYEVQGEALRRVDALDNQIFEAFERGDTARYQELLGQVLEVIRGQGRALSVEDLRPSELILPAPDSTPDEVRALLDQEVLGSGL
jgi:hypothetical protein